MPLEARDWMIRPDMSWPAERVARVLASGEILNTLLWALALQTELRPADQFLNALSMKKLAAALRRPAAGLRPTWDMRPERNRAWEYFWRCFAEGVDRRTFDAADEQQAEAINQWIIDLAEHPHRDLLAGASTIRELRVDEIKRVGLSACFRAVILNLLMRLLDGEDAWQEITFQVYGSLLISQDTGDNEQQEEILLT